MQDGALLVRGMAIGVCGTDRKIAEGAYGTPPPGEARLVIGHKSLGEVILVHPAVSSSGLPRRHRPLLRG
jgi:glucose 1-dehydrogenase